MVTAGIISVAEIILMVGIISVVLQGPSNVFCKSYYHDDMIKGIPNKYLYGFFLLFMFWLFT